MDAGFSGAKTAPACRTPSTAVTNWGELGKPTATRSPWMDAAAGEACGNRGGPFGYLRERVLGVIEEQRRCRTAARAGVGECLSE